jgi:hypothetical protein
VVGRSTGPTVDYRLDVAYDDYPYETSWSLQSLATGGVVAASGALTKWPSCVICCRSPSAWFLTTNTSLWSLIPSVTVCAVATETGPPRFTQLTVDDSNVFITSSNGAPLSVARAFLPGTCRVRYSIVWLDRPDNVVCNGAIATSYLEGICLLRTIIFLLMF